MTTDVPMIKHDWIIDVFDDLISYAEQHGLDALGSEIRKMKKISEQEIRDGSELTQQRRCTPIYRTDYW